MPEKRFSYGRQEQALPRRFWNIAGSGITFQAGSAAVDSSTIMAALVHQLTGSPLAVGAVTTILRVGWLLPQLLVGYLAERQGSSMRYYAGGALGRAICIGLLASLLYVGGGWPTSLLVSALFVMWTAYSFVSGMVAVPYNDIVARTIPAGFRSRLLATRFFGGGLLALGVAAIADGLLRELAFPTSYAAVFAIAAVLMFGSTAAFLSAGEPASNSSSRRTNGFMNYLRECASVFRSDRSFRLFVFAQWSSGLVLMSTPFFVVQASEQGINLTTVALLLSAQILGAIASNILWGWWGDKIGKGSLLQAVAFGRTLPLAIAIVVLLIEVSFGWALFAVFLAVFFLLGALANGLTIAVIGLLMEISPNDRRPSYSGYFNALTAPAYLFPLLGGGIVLSTGLIPLYLVSLVGAFGQFVCARSVRDHRQKM